MPTSITSNAQLRPDLGGSLEEFNLEADRNGFIALQALPVIDVAEQAGVFGVIPVEELLRNADTARAPAAQYSRDTFEFTQDSFAVSEHGHEVVVDERLKNIYRHFFDAERVAARRARDVVLRNFERRAAAMLFNTSNFDHEAAEISWMPDNYSTATPIVDVENAVQDLWEACGLWANGIIIPRQTFRHLRNCEQVIDRLNGMGIRDIVPEKITPQMIGLVFDLPKVMVPGGTSNSAPEGQSAQFTSIWDKDKVMVGVFATSDDITEPCIGRTFHWSEDGSEIGCTIESYVDDSRRGEVVRARLDTQQKLIMTAAGRLITGVASSGE